MELLSIEPREFVIFTLERRKLASCTIRLHNGSAVRVAYKVIARIPDMYIVEPRIGILLPGSGCDVKVTMLNPEEVPADIFEECEDEFFIKSIAVSPRDTVESSQILLRRNNGVKLDNLGAVYIPPTHQDSSDIGGSRSTSSPEQETSRRNFGDLFMKSITIISLCLGFWCLIRMILPLIWSVIFMITMFVTKMMTKLASDSVEEWIVKILSYLSMHYLSVVFRRIWEQI